MKLTLARCALALVVSASFTLPLFSQDYDDGYSPSLWRVRGEYLLWWTNGNRLIPLVTTSPDGTPRAQAGVFGIQGVDTDTLFGGQGIDTDARSGARIAVSRWLGSADETAIEFVGFYVDDDRETGDFVAESLGTPILARPFFNMTSNQSDSELVAFPDVLAGRVAVQSDSEIYSGAALIRHNYGLFEKGRVDFLGGYRYFSFRERLSIRENLESIDQGGVIPLGTTTDLIDRFSTRNEFHGGEFGVAAEIVHSFVSVEAIAKVAVGNVYRQAVISGETTVTVPGNPATTTPGGLLALPTNIGDYSETTLSVLPELNLNANVSITPNASFIFGYSLIVLNDVLRTGGLIDRGVNVTQIGGDPLVGPARPAFNFNSSYFVLQGMNFGLEYLW